MKKRLTNNTYHASIFVLKKFRLTFTSDAYFQEPFGLDFIMKANTMIPDQTAKSIFFVIMCGSRFFIWLMRG